MALTPAQRQARYRETGRMVEVNRRWAERNRERERERSRTRRRTDPDTFRAWDAVNHAIRSGRLVRGPCEHASGECLGRIEAHHDDYTQPLIVRWLCVRHHRRLHRQPAAA